MPVRKTAAAKVAKPAVVEGEVADPIETVLHIETGEELVPIEFAPGLTIWMRKINPSQFAVLADEASRARKNPDQALRVIEVFFLIIESLIPNEDDVLRLRDAIALRQATIDTIIPALEREDAGAPTTGPAKRTRRGR